IYPKWHCILCPPPPLDNPSFSNIDSYNSQISPHTSYSNTHFPLEGMDMLYLAEKVHFWHRSRVEFIYQQVSKQLVRLYGKEHFKQQYILDVGAGTGSVTRYFLSQGFEDMALGEIHSQGLEYAKTYGISKLFCMDLLDVPFEDEFDCIFAFDVIEHIENDKESIINMKKMLKNNAKSLLCVSVPAHQWLWNAHDVLVHHKRRYTKGKLMNLFKECGLYIEMAQYFFVALTPLLFARALLSPAKKAQKLSKEALRDVPPPKILNSALLGLCRLENALLPLLPFGMPFGGSLLLVARKV
uniref:class I SAM-dependent methyltransferase n=1 Tax=uncultured Helicobacter sp. TaxID=175537 RepID=UPI00344D2018